MMNSTLIRRAGGLALGMVLVAWSAPAQAQLFGRSEPSDEKGMDEVRAPHMTFNEVSHDFGLVPDTRPVHWSVDFTNTGNDMLIVEDIQSECGCTVPELDVFDFLPGESGTLNIQFDPRGRPGRHTKHVTIRSNDIEHPTDLKIQLDIEVYKAVEISKPTLPLGRLIKGRGGSGIVTLTSKRDHFVVKRVVIAGSNVTCDVGEPKKTTLDDGTTATQIDAEFHIDKDAPVGWLDRNITFETEISSEDGSEVIEHPVRFHVSGQIGGKIQISPERMSFGTPAPGTDISREIRLYSLTDEPFNITAARVETESDVALTLKTDTVEVNNKTIPRIVVTGVAPENKGSFTGKIIISTDMPDEDDLQVNFFGSVRAPFNRPIFNNTGDGTSTNGSSPAAGESDGDSGAGGGNSDSTSKPVTKPATKPKADDGGQ